MLYTHKPVDSLYPIFVPFLCTELTISIEQVEYSVLESDGTVAVNVSITSFGGWEVPLEFDVILQNDSATLGQKQLYKQLMT